MPLQEHPEDVWGCFQLPLCPQIATGVERVGGGGGMPGLCAVSQTIPGNEDAARGLHGF